MSLDPKIGESYWEYDITRDGEQSSFHGNMLLTEDAVLIGTDSGEGHIYSFDQRTGEANWMFPAGRGVGTDIVPLGDRIYAVTLEDHLVCLDRETGDLRWRMDSDVVVGQRSGMGSTPAVSKDRVFFGSLDGNVHALNAVTGEPIWKTNVGGQVITATLLHDGALFVGTDYAEIHKLDPKSGAVENSLQMDFPVRGHFLPTPEGNIVAFLSDSDWEGSLVAFTPGLEIEWVVDPPDGGTFTSARPYRSGSWILAGTGRGTLHAVDVASGEVAWSFAVDPDRDWSGNGLRVFSVHGDVLYVGTISGALYAFGIEGEQKAAPSSGS